jgi:hypothetical protein
MFPATSGLRASAKFIFFRPSVGSIPVTKSIIFDDLRPPAVGKIKNFFRRQQNFSGDLRPPTSGPWPSAKPTKKFPVCKANNLKKK